MPPSLLDLLYTAKHRMHFSPRQYGPPTAGTDLEQSPYSEERHFCPAQMRLCGKAPSLTNGTPITPLRRRSLFLMQGTPVRYNKFLAGLGLMLPYTCIFYATSGIISQDAFSLIGFSITSRSGQVVRQLHYKHRLGGIPPPPPVLMLML